MNIGLLCSIGKTTLSYVESQLIKEARRVRWNGYTNIIHNNPCILYIKTVLWCGDYKGSRANISRPVRLIIL
jgi:hypothetical protein